MKILLKNLNLKNFFGNAKKSKILFEILKKLNKKILKKFQNIKSNKIIFTKFFVIFLVLVTFSDFKSVFKI